MKHLTLALAFAIALPVQAQNYPVKPVRIIVPNAPGGGSDMQARFIGKRLNEATGQPFVISVTHIPYRSGGPAIAALMSGETDFTFSGAVTALPQIRAARVRALAVTSLKRSPRAPEVPTLDSFYAGYESANWYAMFVPAGTPAAVINKLHSDSVTAIRSAEMKEFMAAEGADPVASTPAELGAYLRHEIERYARVIKSANIRAE